MRYLRTIFIAIIAFLFIAGCGRPGGKGEDNIPGSYLQVTNATLSGDKVTIEVRNIFKDSTVTAPNSLYDVTVTSYTLTYFRSDGTPILSTTNNNTVYIYVPVGSSTATQASFTLIPSPDSLSYSSASVYIFGKNGYGDKTGTTFYLPTLGGSTTTTTTTTTTTGTTE